jgi:hypothetical protein
MGGPDSIMRRALVFLGIALAATSGACASQTKSVAAYASAGADFSSDRAADLCAGLSSSERERPSFLRQQGIDVVRPLEGGHLAAGSLRDEVRGAEIHIRPSPDLTRNAVARSLRCHLADPIALALREPFEDPLLVGTPHVSLESSAEGVVIRIAGHDGVEGQEILRRAEGLQRN